MILPGPATLRLENFSPAWLFLLLIAGSLALLVFTYRGMRQRSGRRLVWWLLAVRAVAVGGLWMALVKPAWTSEQAQKEPRQVAVILDDSQSMSLPRQAGGEDLQSRYAVALEWLRESAAGRALSDDLEVRLFGADGRPLDAPPAEPSGAQTDLMRAVRSAGRHLAGRAAAGVILISDGADTTGRGDWMGLGDFPLPVHGVGFAAPPPSAGDPVDLKLLSVEAPPRALVHNTVNLRLLVEQTGSQELQVVVAIQRGAEVLHTHSITLPASRKQSFQDVPFTPAQPGDFVLSARLLALPGERTSANNARLFRLRVQEKPIRVLLVEGTLRLEFTFLQQRLKNDPDVDLITLVRSANPRDARAAVALLGAELLRAERLEEVDVVLLGDFEADMLQPSAYAALRAWVEAGGGLMVLGGYRNLSEQGLWRTVLADLLPATQAPAPFQQIEIPFRFEPGPAGLAHPALQISGNRQQDLALWRALPELGGCVAVGAARPGAVVLARHPAPDPDAPQGRVVLALQPFGKGRVGLMTADTTWRWSRLVRMAGRPDTLYVRFWSQMVRHLAQRDEASQVTALTVSTDRPSYRRGRPVRITVRRNPAAVLPAPPDAPVQVRLSLRSPDGAQRGLPVEASTSESDRYDAVFFPERGGRFELSAHLEVVGAADSQTVASQVTEFMVEGSRLELDNADPRPATLRQIARLTGGLYAEIGDEAATASLVAGLPRQPQITYQVATLRFWNQPLLFLAFVALVSAEWFLRRRNQLV